MMPSPQTVSERGRRSTRRNRSLALALFAGAMIPALATAQSPGDRIVTILKSGLHSFAGDALLTVTEVGSRASASEVTIELRSAGDERRAFTSGMLLRGQPVRLRVPIAANAGRQQGRFIVRITSISNPEQSQAVVGLEDLDVDSFGIETKPPCAPPSVGGGAEGNCDGWHVTRLTAGQAGSSSD
jgi:hypothetical protein